MTKKLQTNAQSSRRQFLRGAAGFTLALPFMESLLDKKAAAGLPPYAANARFVCMTTQHGAVWGENMWPGDDVAPNASTLYSGHTAYQGALSPVVVGNSAALSPVLSASDASLLSPDLVSKMNLIRGLDVPFYLGHHTGGDLGNFGRNDGEFDDPNPMEYRPTIDQVMAYSDSFYPDLSAIRERSMHIGTHVNHCWGYSNPETQSGALQSMPLSQSAMALFNLIFVPEEVEENPRPLIVDRVVEHYQSVRQNSRLSSADGQRLDDHMDRLHDLQTRLNAVANCGDVIPPTGDSNGLDVGGYSNNFLDARTYYQLYNDVIVAAFICGTSRIAVINSGETWSGDFPGLCCDWHQEVAHRAHEPDGVRQQILADGKQRFFESVFLDLVNKLNVVENDDITYLDNTLVFWTQEAGSTTHDPISLPIVTAGSGAGYFETGQYVDYRNRNNMELSDDYSPQHQARRPGIPYQRFLANSLMAMGLPVSEFERPGESGYGDNFINNTAAHPQATMDDASLPLPFLVS